MFENIQIKFTRMGISNTIGVHIQDRDKDDYFQEGTGRLSLDKQGEGRAIQARLRDFEARISRRTKCCRKNLPIYSKTLMRCVC